MLGLQPLEHEQEDLIRGSYNLKFNAKSVLDHHLLLEVAVQNLRHELETKLINKNQLLLL
jgi:hypothetical protein